MSYSPPPPQETMEYLENCEFFTYFRWLSLPSVVHVSCWCSLIPKRHVWGGSAWNEDIK